MSLNRCIFMGRLSKDPELRRTGSGIAVTSFSIAVDRDVVNKESNERKTDFLDCVAWRQTGEFVAKYFKKGSMIVVDCRAEQRQWTDKDGNKRYSIEFNVDNAYFGEPKKDGANNGGGYAAPAGGGYAAPAGGGYAAPAGGGYAAPAGGGYAAPAGGFAPGPAPAPAPAAPVPSYGVPNGGYAPAPAPAGGYASAPAAPVPAPAGYATAPVAPASDFAMLDDSDAQLPF